MLRNPKLGLAVSLLFAGAMWFYMQHVVIGRQQADAALHGIPRGNLCDLYPRWLGARELLLHHRNPYSPEITRQIQIGYYGRALDPSRPQDPQDQMAFAYPLYVVFLLAPSITLPFLYVRMAAHWFFVLLTAASIPIWLRAMRWRVSLALTATLVILTLGTLPVALGIKLEQLTLLVGGMAAGCVLLVVTGYPVFAGILLAFATIKPQLVFLFAIWLVLWVCGNYRQRRRFLWSFVLTMIILLSAAEFVMPGWIGQFVQAMAAYRQYTGRPVSVLAVFTNFGWGLCFSVLLLFLLMLICWRARKAPADDRDFTLVSALVLVVTGVVIPMTSLYNQILLLPAILLLVRYAGTLWRQGRVTRLLCILLGLLIVWPWLAALVLNLTSLLAAESLILQKAWLAPLWTSMTIPVVVLLLLLRLVWLIEPNLMIQSTASHYRVRSPAL